MFDRIRSWLGSWVDPDAPESPSRLDDMDHAARPRRLSNTPHRGCLSCGYMPPAGERVVGPCVPGHHDLALVGWPTPAERAAGFLPSVMQEQRSREDDEQQPTGECPPLSEHQARIMSAPIEKTDSVLRGLGLQASTDPKTGHVRFTDPVPDDAPVPYLPVQRRGPAPFADWDDTKTEADQSLAGGAESVRFAAEDIALAAAWGLNVAITYDGPNR